MREYIYLFLILCLSGLFFASLTAKGAPSSSTDVQPLTGAQQRVLECYGTSTVNSATWNQKISCNDNETNTTCTDSSGNPGILIGYVYNHSGGWDPSDDCYAKCGNTSNPQSNCKWVTP